MINKISSLISVLYKGNKVADPEVWKNRTVAVNGVTALIVSVLALASSFGFDFGISNEQAEIIASAIVIVVFAGINIMSTLATSDKVGLPSKRVDDESQVNEWGDEFGNRD